MRLILSLTAPLLIAAHSTDMYCVPRPDHEGVPEAEKWVCDSGQSGINCDDKPTECNDRAAWGMSKYYATFGPPSGLGTCDFSGSAQLLSGPDALRIGVPLECIFGVPTLPPSDPPTPPPTDAKMYCVPNPNSVNVPNAEGWVCDSGDSGINCNDLPQTCDNRAAWGMSKYYETFGPPAGSVPLLGLGPGPSKLTAVQIEQASAVGNCDFDGAGNLVSSGIANTLGISNECLFGLSSGEPSELSPPPSNPSSGGASRCGIATSLNECISTRAAVGEDMECFSYGGASDPCSLNNNNDDNDGLDKDPSQCSGDHLFLWDEPDTQGKSYRWAGEVWVSYCARWSSELVTFKARGGRVVGPAVKNDRYVSNMAEFMNACGSACVTEGPCKIDAAASNVFTGSWNNGDWKGAVRWSMNEFAKSSYRLPLLITNWSYLGGQTPDDQLPTMAVTSEFFASDAPVQVDRVYFFFARDFGGGSNNNLATSVTRDGRTLGDHWKDTCEVLDTTRRRETLARRLGGRN